MVDWKNSYEDYTRELKRDADATQ
ncbi:hypothetical protein CFJ47_001079 [Salmonella enterica]|nr:hypothetical protein [Salmonella enterica]